MATWIFLLLSVLAVFDLSQCRYSLHHEDTLYLPFEYTPIPRYEYNRGAGGKIRYDYESKFAYISSRDLIHVISLEDLLHLDNVFHIHEPGFQFTDVALCGDFVITPADNTIDRDNGKLFIFNKYSHSTATMPLVQVIDLPHNPKHITFSKDCMKILVSLEGVAYEKDGVFTDPDGGVAFVSFPSSDLSTTANVKILDFTKFNSQADEYVRRGVRHVYPHSTFSQDIEPEGITLRYDEKVAYVSLQENNAIAEIDVSDFSSATIVELFPLGYKAWHDLLMDPSDWDQAIRLNNWKVFGMYQPDAVQYFESDNVGYLLCANEGASKVYSNWTEVKRGQDFMLENLVHDGVSQEIKDALLTTSNLGRLEFSTRNGLEVADGKYSDFYAFGARGWTIRRADNPSTIVFDSGDLTASHHSTLAPILFNADPTQVSSTMLQTRDILSDEKGPETETVAIGTIDGEKLFFIGNGAASTIEVYSVRHGITKPVFHNITFASPFIDVGKPWNTLYTERNTGDIDPDGIEFISARDSPVLKDLLLVSGSVSGTVSVYIISLIDEIEDDVLAARVNNLFDHADNDSNELISREEHEELIMEGDVDGNNRVDRYEFLDDFQAKVGLLEERLDFVFTELDANHDRFLDKYDADTLFYLADRDATSSLSRNQFGREWKRVLHDSLDLSRNRKRSQQRRS